MTMTTTAPDKFELTIQDVCFGQTGSVSFTDGKVHLIRFRPGWKWEYSEIAQKGRCRGLRRFVRFLAAEECARLDSVVETEFARRRLAARGLSAEQLCARKGWGLSPSGRLVG